MQLQGTGALVQWRGWCLPYGATSGWYELGQSQGVPYQRLLCVLWYRWHQHYWQMVRKICMHEGSFWNHHGSAALACALCAVLPTGCQSGQFCYGVLFMRECLVLEAGACAGQAPFRPCWLPYASAWKTLLASAWACLLMGMCIRRCTRTNMYHTCRRWPLNVPRIASLCSTWSAPVSLPTRTPTHLRTHTHTHKHPNKTSTCTHRPHVQHLEPTPHGQHQRILQPRERRQRGSQHRGHLHADGDPPGVCAHMYDA